jgi:hypothetical protein
MTVSAFMINPSIWMQEAFFHSAEVCRREKIGVECTGEGIVTHLSVRVLAVAHAALQCLYASIAAGPICLVTAITIVLTPFPTGLASKDGTLLERLAWSVGIAFMSVWAPVAASLAAVVDIRSLNNAKSFPVSTPVYYHGLLLSVTLPSLENLSSHFSFLHNLQTRLCGAHSWYQRLATEGFLYFAGTQSIRNFLRSTDQSAFRWRLELPNTILELTQKNISRYSEAFDVSSMVFFEALGMAIVRCTDS